MLDFGPYPFYGNSQAMKLTAPIAMPTPKTMPASIRLDSPSPKANMSPPTTIATRLKPRAMGPVNADWRTLTAVSQGESAWAGTANRTVPRTATAIGGGRSRRQTPQQAGRFTFLGVVASAGRRDVIRAPPS